MADEYIRKEDALEITRLSESNLAWNIGNRIRWLPSADVRPVVHARWRICLYPGNEHVECTACKVEYCEEDLYLGGSEFPKFCPDCGATMDAEVCNETALHER